MSRKKATEDGLVAPLCPTPATLPSQYREISQDPCTPNVALQLPPPSESAKPAPTAATIVERQLALLGERSARGLLTFDETKALESLVKLQMLMRARAAAGKGEDPFADTSTEELKHLMELLR